MLNERKLTERELESREVVLQGLLQNKQNLVKKYGKDAEKVMYGIATKKAKTKVESMNKDKIKELIYKTLTREDATPKGEDFFYDYLDIGMSYLEGFGKKHSLDDTQLEKLGKKIVDQLYKGDVGKAYDAIVKRGAMNEDEDKEPSKADLKKTKGLAKAKEELAQLTKQMKSLARKYKEAEGEEKEKIVADLKKKTKLKKELEAIIDK